jgi:cytosine/adenosine deaminase-related metal-dependent hydrolase
MFRWSRPVSLVNARVVTAGGLATSIRFGARILALDEKPNRGDVVVDLEGAFVLPGLINAHDHLELNHYGSLRPRERYVNVADWIADLRPLIRHSENVRQASSYSLRARLFIGGLKNLLAGVTTVAHHNPIYAETTHAVASHVVSRFGWAHSLAMAHEPVGARGEPGGDVGQRCAHTPPDWPFIVHAAEGVDERAAEELNRLRAAECLRPHTLFVHGVAFSLEDWRRIVDAGAGLIWCPGSNLFLFGRTALVREFLDASPPSADHICLGSDSRLTGARDLLDELRCAQHAGVAPSELLHMVTTAAARLLRLADAGVLAVGAPSDLIVVPPRGSNAAVALLATSRHDLRLVVVDGEPLVGDCDLRAVFDARAMRMATIAVDDRERIAARWLARAIGRCPIHEPGVVGLRAA